MSKVFNISVVGGAGHIGLPLSCYLQNHGHKVTVIDKNQKVMNDASNGIEPFEEIDFEDNLNEALKNGLNFSNDMSVVAQTDYVFITLGTSSNKDDIKLFDGVIDQVLRNVEDETKIILRSTVTLESIFKVKNNKLFHEKKLFLSYCPERIAEGFAFVELNKIPQIIGTDNPIDKKIFNEFFETLDVKIINTSFENAVFTKLFSNAYRNAEFSLVNVFNNIAEENDINFEEIKEIATFEYPRLKSLPKTGYVGGPCLPKDLDTFIKNYSSENQILINILKSSDEYLDNIVRKCESKFKNKELIQLGITFKKNSDDLRSSGSYILYKKLIESGFKVFVVDPYIVNLDTDFEKYEYENLHKKIHNVLYCVDHHEFEKYDLREKNIIYAEF